MIVISDAAIAGSYILGSFALGWVAGYLLYAFRRGSFKLR